MGNRSIYLLLGAQKGFFFFKLFAYLFFIKAFKNKNLQQGSSPVHALTPRIFLKSKPPPPACHLLQCWGRRRGGSAAGRAGAGYLASCGAAGLPSRESPSRSARGAGGGRRRWLGRGAAAAGERRRRARGAGRTPQLRPRSPGGRSRPWRAPLRGCGAVSLARAGSPPRASRAPVGDRWRLSWGVLAHASPAAAGGPWDVRGRQAEPGAPQWPAQAPMAGPRRAERAR